MRRKKIIIIVIALIVLSGGFLWFYIKYLPPKPNILLICIDTLRPDYLSCYGDTKYHTPHIDQLAAQGILFENCLTPCPITLPAHFSIFYSLLPHQERVYNNGDVVRTSKPSLAQMLKGAEEKTQTAAIVSLGVLKRRFKLDAGFDYYNDYFNPEKGLWYRRADEITDEALKWLKKQQSSKEPFFFFVHYSDPHEPYSPPDMLPDLQVFFNGEALKNVVLSSGEIYRFVMNLKPGLNEVKLVSLDDKGKPLNPSPDIARCYLNFLRVYPLIGIEIKYTNFYQVNVKRKKRFYLGNPAIVQLINSSDREEKIVLSFSGRTGANIQQIKDLYGREAQFCDRHIGRLIDGIEKWGMGENLIIMLISDHGEGLGQHKLTGHIDQLYDSLLKVPFIIYSPKLKQRGQRISQPAGLIDIAPTILNLYKIKIPEWMKGVPLLTRRLDLITQSKDRIFFSETFTPDAIVTKFGLRTYKWKLIYTPKHQFWELYYVRRDVGETNNVFERRKEKESTVFFVNQIKEKFASHLSLKEKRKKEKLDRETLEMLKSLGYIQ